MLKNKNIICISSIDWDFIWQGHQEIMSTFAKEGNQVLFIENTGVRAPHLKDLPRIKKRIKAWLKGTMGFRNEAPNLYVYSPIIMPFPYSRIARWFNRRLLIRSIKNWAKIMDFYNPIIWTFLPTGTALDIINNLEHKLLVYYCIADFNELADNPKKVNKTEEELIRKCDLIFAQGKVLEEKCRRFNPNVHIFPFGVNIENFTSLQHADANIPEDIKEISHPIIGYAGGLHKHLDFQLLRSIAQAHPEWSLVLVGPLQHDEHLSLNGHKNIFLLNQKKFSQLPYYIKEFDVCIVPYRRTKYTDTVYPTKINEYHAMGKPVVSTFLPEVEKFNRENDNLIITGKSKEEFVQGILKALNDKDESLVHKRVASAKKNSWIMRINEMSNLIKLELANKSKKKYDWRKNLMQSYLLAKKRIVKIVFICLAAYLIIFYTPLVWMLADPLRIAQPPRKADAIVVFAGGVGESGKAGQGYEERVQYAAALYKSGFSGHIIFSSGYKYIYNESLMMQSLALSLGIPKEAIELEEKATNTYENVLFSRDILKSRNWKKVLLISSPYHMRRVSLVFNKIDNTLDVYYTPIPNSLYYSHERFDSDGRRIWRQISVEQIKGILHEYLSILYYKIKGLI